MSVNPYEEAERLSVAGAGSREVESWALLELAKRLDRVRREQKQEENLPALSEIVRLNWRAWTIIQSSLLDASNPISPELRGDLLTLCAFIDKHSTQLLSSPDAAKVQILIDINMHLGQGLRGERLSDAEQKTIVQAQAKAASQEKGETTQDASSDANDKRDEEDASALNAANLNAAKPVAVKPAAVKPVAVKPVAVKPVAVKPVAVKPIAVKKEAQKVETGIAVDL